MTGGSSNIIPIFEGAGVTPPEALRRVPSDPDQSPGTGSKESREPSPFEGPLPAFLVEGPRFTAKGWRGHSARLPKISRRTALERSAIAFHSARRHFHQAARRLKKLLLFRKSLQVPAPVHVVKPQ